MGIKVISPPSALLSLAELRLHLKLDTVGGVHPDDTLIAKHLTAAHEYCEHYTGRSFGNQTLELALDEFPSGAIQLPSGPVVSITSVTYVSTTTLVDTVLVNTAYVLDDYSVPAWLTPAYNTVWPDTLGTPNSVRIRYAAGAATLPSAVYAALLLIVGHLYEHREESTAAALSKIPMGVEALLDTQRTWSNF